MMLGRTLMAVLCVTTASAFLTPLGVPSLTSRFSSSSKIPSLRRPMLAPVLKGARIPKRIGGGRLGLRASSSAENVVGGEGEQVLVARKTLIDGEMRPALVAVKGALISSVKTLSEDDFVRISSDASGAGARAAGGVGVGAGVALLGDDEMLVPAFVNGHTHLAMGALRGITGSGSFDGNVVEDLFFKLEVSLEEEDVRAFVRMGCWESLLAGVGFCWEHYYFADAIVQAFLDTGMTGIVAPTLQDLSGPGLVLPGCGAQDAIRDTLKIHHDSSLAARGVGAALGAHATDTVSAELWKQLGETAGSETLPIHAHLAQSLEELERAVERHGVSPLQLLADQGVLDASAPCLLVHSMYVTSADLKLLDPARHVLGLCPASAVQFGFPCDYPTWHEAGLKIALGTDAACSNDNMNVQQELRLLAGGALFAVRDSAQHAAFAAAAPSDAVPKARAVNERRAQLLERSKDFNVPATLLPSVLSIPGKLHPTVRAGAIEEGLLANLLVIDASHPALWPNHDPLRSLCFSDISAAAAGMLVAGKWVGERGNFQRSILQSKLYQAHRAEADSRFQALIKRAGLVPQAK